MQSQIETLICWGPGDSRIGKVLALQNEHLSLIPRIRVFKNHDIIVLTENPSTEAETDRASWLTSLLTSSRTVDDLVSRGEKKW